VLATGYETHPCFSMAAAGYPNLFAPGADGSMIRHIRFSLLFLKLAAYWRRILFKNV
jgi:hypothetical protein